MPQKRLHGGLFDYNWEGQETFFENLEKRLGALGKATITFDAYEILQLASEMEEPVKLTSMQVFEVLRRIEQKTDFDSGLSWDSIAYHIREVL